MKKEEKKDRKWTTEAKKEFRKTLPEKLNKLGEWFFSEDSEKEYLVIKDMKAVMR